MGISRTTRLNWILDAGVFFTALVAGFSGLYFLYVPVGGYQGGKNPLYGITILFSRSTWDDLHLWGGDDLDCYDPSPLSLGLGCDDVQEDLESNSIWEVEHVPWRKEQFGSQPSYSHEFPACRGLWSLFLVRSYGRL